MCQIIEDFLEEVTDCALEDGLGLGIQRRVREGILGRDAIRGMYAS